MFQRFEQEQEDGGNMVRWGPERCSNKSRKCSSGDTAAVDWLSTFPDHLLNIILSRLTLKEHIATSILSRRWKYLWGSRTRLDFDGVDSIMSIQKSFGWWYDEIERDETLSAYEKLRFDFLSRVDHVLESRERSDIEEFKVCFNLGKRDEEYINKWLIYALACKVQRLELNLNMTMFLIRGPDYVIPHTLFSHGDKEVGFNPNPIHFKQLRTISLNGVGVDCKSLKFFLENCHLLEDLCVKHSSSLFSLRVVGPFPSLKRLEISHCHKLDSIEIRDVNLVSFKYVGLEKPFVLENVAMLAHLSVPLSTLGYMKVNIAQFSSIFKQLEIFRVNVEAFKTPFRLPVEMGNLKQLEVVIKPIKDDASYLWLSTLIQSAPRMQKFVLESHAMLPEIPKSRKYKRIENSYPQLKEVEFVGFYGSPSDLEFVFHFVENAAALKHILLDTKNPSECLAKRMFIRTRKCNIRVARRLLEEKLALENPAIKLEFLSNR